MTQLKMHVYECSQCQLVFAADVDSISNPQTFKVLEPRCPNPNCQGDPETDITGVGDGEIDISEH